MGVVRPDWQGGAQSPEMRKQKEAGLRKNTTPLLRAMMMQMAPMTISVRLIRANMPEAMLRPGGGERGCRAVSLLKHCSSSSSAILLACISFVEKLRARIRRDLEKKRREREKEVNWQTERERKRERERELGEERNRKICLSELCVSERKRASERIKTQRESEG